MNLTRLFWKCVSLTNCGILLLFIFLVLLNAGCGGNGGTTTTANLPPVGNLTVTDLFPESVLAPKTVQFTVTFSDPEGKPVSAVLHFGDGESVVITTSGSVVEHTYNSQGYFQPLLALWDDLTSRTVTVYVGNDSRFRIVVQPAPPKVPLNVTVVGQGTVTSDPAGINCPGDCSEEVIKGSLVNMRATPAPGWEFAGWDGDCDGTIPEIPIPMHTPKTCTATFREIRYSLTVTRDGLGTVISNPEGIECPPDCSENYAAMSVVSLTATPEPGWLFGGWSGACSGINPTAVVLMNADKTCKAIFAQTHELNVAVNGQGTVTSNPQGINCPGDCGETFLSLTVVTLTAQASPGWAFTGWTGDCTGTNSSFQITVNAFKSCTANFSPVYPLTVTINGQGSVVSNPDGINCPGDCSELYLFNSVITLRATPAAGWAFGGWSGDCGGFSPSTQVTVTAAKNCVATFGLARDLTVVVNGQGSVTSLPAGINCPDDCSGSYLSGTVVTLTATPASGWVLDFWSGDCSGAGPSTSVVLDANRTCAANFLQLRYSLTVSINGTGTVTSDPAGITCPGTCTATYLSNTEVTLTATPPPGWVFDHWSSDCSGTSPVISVRLGSDSACTANFSQRPLLSVTLNGGGSVSSDPPGISCPPDCSEAYVYGAMVTLTATPASGWAFKNWSGDCSGVNPSVQVPMTAVKNCIANFSQLHYSLNLTVTGQGSVSSDPPGISCPGDCFENYLSNSVITLTAVPAPGWEFSSWTGDCSGINPTLRVTLSTSKNCGATFTQLEYPVTIAIIGNGTVISSPPGISCPADCSEPFLSNTVVTLTAAPASGWMFVAWSGDCSGVNPTTQVMVDAAKLCTANFTELQYTLTVALNGEGTVAEVPAGGINCPPDCTEVYLDGTVVTLSATPAVGWSFVNWSDGCSGTNPETQVTMDADKTCTANFALNIYTLTVTVNGLGTVMSDDGGIACPGDCSEDYPFGTVVTLNSTPYAGWYFGGWGGDCSGMTPVAQVTINANTSCTATFTTTPPFIYFEDFETDDGGWTHGNYPPNGQNDTWHRAKTTCDGVALGSWAYGANGNLGPSCVEDSARERSFAMSPPITLPSSGPITLKFQAWAQDEMGSCLSAYEYDRKDVGITTDGGNTYTRLNDCNKLVTQPDVWEDRSFDISAWAGQTIQIIFVYDTIDQIIGKNFYIDNVEITSP